MVVVSRYLFFSNENEIAEVLNYFFSNIIKTLVITENVCYVCILMMLLWGLLLSILNIVVY